MKHYLSYILSIWIFGSLVYYLLGLPLESAVNTNAIITVIAAIYHYYLYLRGAFPKN